MNILKLSDAGQENILSHAERILKKGGVIIGPSDTVYGLYADATNEEAVKKIFKIKKRAPEKALPIFVKDIATARKLAYIDDRKARFLEKIWPAPLEISPVRSRTQTHASATSNGISRSRAAAAAPAGQGGSLTGPGAVTVVFHHKGKLPKILTGGLYTIAIRIPDHPLLLELLGRLNFPLAQSSANLSGRSPISAVSEIGDERLSETKLIELVIDGGELPKQPSTVVDFTSNEPIILRRGIITKEDFDKLLVL